jgi:dienelactone hydrolase
MTSKHALPILSRRSLLGHCVGALAVVAGVPACRKANASFTCADTRALSADELQARVALAYVDAAADPWRPCVQCAQYVQAPSDGSCGTCKLLKGPIHPNGSCKAFAAR